MATIFSPPPPLPLPLPILILHPHRTPFICYKYSPGFFSQCCSLPLEFLITMVTTEIICIQLSVDMLFFLFHFHSQLPTLQNRYNNYQERTSSSSFTFLPLKRVTKRLFEAFRLYTRKTVLKCLNCYNVQTWYMDLGDSESWLHDEGARKYYSGGDRRL